MLIRKLLHLETIRLFNTYHLKGIVVRESFKGILLNTTPNILITSLVLMLFVLYSGTSYAEDWGDWGKETNRLNEAADLESTISDLENDEDRQRELERIAPLDAKEQAVFRALDNSSLSDYSEKRMAREPELPAGSLFESLERLEQLQLLGADGRLHELSGEINSPADLLRSISIATDADGRLSIEGATGIGISGSRLEGSIEIEGLDGVNIIEINDGFFFLQGGGETLSVQGMDGIEIIELDDGRFSINGLDGMNVIHGSDGSFVIEGTEGIEVFETEDGSFIIDEPEDFDVIDDSFRD